MNYGKGTIVFVSRTKFADNGQYDNRPGHPAMLPIASDSITDETYYVLLTSDVSKINLYPHQYYDLTEVWEEIPLKRPSLINLASIYKANINNDKLGGLPPRVYKDVIKALKRYQESHPCDNYKKIANKI